MPHPQVPRIGLIGGECTGKSTLAQALAQALDGCLVTEVLRDFVIEHGRPPRQEEQAFILEAQVRREAEAAEACRGAALVADPAPFMTAVYSLLYFDDPALIPAAVDDARGYDLLVWCSPDLPWIPDEGQRDGPEMRDAADLLIASLVAEQLKPAGVHVLRVEGDHEARVTAVRLAWQPGPLQGPT